MIHPLVTYQRVKVRWCCQKCGATIQPKEMFYKHIVPGLSIKEFCHLCPPYGAEHARKAYRDKHL